MNKKILIIDDHVDIREMYERALKEEGFEVTSAEDGIEGMKKTMEFKPHLILLDIMMPKMDGFILLNSLQNIEDKNFKVVILSNLDSKEYIKQGLELGALKYMLKSDYTPEEVVEEVVKICNEDKA